MFRILVKTFPKILDVFIYQISLLGTFVTSSNAKYAKLN